MFNLISFDASNKDKRGQTFTSSKIKLEMRQLFNLIAFDKAVKNKRA